MRYWWIRHAPVDHGGRLYGCSDWPCLPFGEEDVLHLREVLPLGEDVSVVTSGLSRTHETLKMVDEGAWARSVQEVRLNEQNLGVLEGEDFARLVGGEHGEWSCLLENFLDHCPEGGESFSQVVTRVGEALEDLTLRFAGEDDVVVVCHAGVIRAAIVYCLALSGHAAMSFELSPLSLTVLERVKGLSGKGERWRLLCSNWGGGRLSF